MKNKRKTKISPIDVIMINWVGEALEEKKINIAKKLAGEKTELDYTVESTVFMQEVYDLKQNKYVLSKDFKEPGFRLFSEDFKDFDVDLVESVFPTSIGDYTAHLIEITPCVEEGDFVVSSSIGFVIRYED